MSLPSLLAALLLAATIPGEANAPEAPALEPYYCDQRTPGRAPELFAPGLVSTLLSEDSRPSFAPDRPELLFHVNNGEQHTILRVWKEGGAWRGPEVAGFSGRYPDELPVHAPDGRRVYFRSRRPVDGGDEPTPGYHAFFVERTATGWSPPQRAPDFDRCVLSGFDAERNAWCHGVLVGSAGAEDIYQLEATEDGFGAPRALRLNGEGSETWPSRSPDGRLLLLTLDGAPAVSRLVAGEWTTPIPLAEHYLYRAEDEALGFSPDGRFVFFVGWRFLERRDRERRLTWDDILAHQAGPQNIGQDIYWMDARVFGDVFAGEVAP